MVKTKVGRVFFHPESGPDVEKVTVLTLDSHVANVVTLVEKFRRNFYPTFDESGQETREFLIRAAKKHDDAKPDTFRITYRGWKENGQKSLGYSFAGHRFRVADDERYVELLIRLHHEFSVEEIVKAQAALQIPTQAKNFPIDLYILEMCDQIEAEVETYAFTRDPQPRVFMDFHSRRHEDGQRVEVDPYPFGDAEIRPESRCEHTGHQSEVNPYPFGDAEIRLSLAYYELNLGKAVPKEHLRIVKTLRSENPREGQDLLRQVIIKAPQYAECQHKEMILCRAH